MIEIVEKIVRIPLMGLLHMNFLTEILTDDSLTDPFSSGWGSWKVIALSSLYLRLLSASRLGQKTMELAELCPGADWRNDAGIIVTVPTPEQIQFISLGAKIDTTTTSVYLGSDGLGNALNLRPGTVAMAMNINLRGMGWCSSMACKAIRWSTLLKYDLYAFSTQYTNSKDLSQSYYT